MLSFQYKPALTVIHWFRLRRLAMQTMQPAYLVPLADYVLGCDVKIINTALLCMHCTASCSETQENENHLYSGFMTAIQDALKWYWQW